MFSQLNLQVAEGGQLDTIRQSETMQAFKPLREDLTAMAYASFLAEFVAEICPEHHPEARAYEILLAAFSMFTRRNPRIVALAAAYQLLECTGYQPDYTRCCGCGCLIEADAFFSIEKNGAVCSVCAQAGERPFSVKMQGFIQHLLRLNWQEPASFTISGAILLQAETLLLDYLLAVLEKPLKSLDFIRQLTLLPKG